MKMGLILLLLMAQSCFITCQHHQYIYVGEKKSWSEAQQHCRERHTDLATVSNMAGMKRLISDKPESMNEAWIGLRDQTAATRTWYWSLPGVEFNDSQTKWVQGEPNDLGGVENCGVINNALLWVDTSCGSKFGFLCYNESETSEKFYFIQEEKTWLEAQMYCRENHADLVSGWEQTQDAALQNKIKNKNLNLFMGLFRDTWRWSDGSSVSFRHWSLQFNTQLYNTGQCAMAVFGDGGRWMNHDCNEQKPFICYGEKFILIRENKTWEEALYYCRDHHHDLVTITHPDDQRWIQEKVKNASTPFVWTGLRYTCTLDFWFWVNDRAVGYKNWVSGGPEDDCDMSGAMETGGQHQWVKKNDNEELNFICSTA